MTNGKLRGRTGKVKTVSGQAGASCAKRKSEALEPHMSHYCRRVGDLVFSAVCGLRAPHALAKQCRRRVASARAMHQLVHLMGGRDPATGRSFLKWCETGETAK